MNDDRISEVYKGEIWADDAQERARRRVNWMVGQAVGDRVLDIGCSQGIASILLGREGFAVTGMDIQESRIEYAKEDLANESPGTQDRVEFRVGDASEQGFEDDAFDTVLLGEVLEHLVAPERMLLEVKRVVRSGGRVVITTPFGVLHHHDHKQTFFPRGVLSLIGQHLGVVSVDIQDRYFRIVATPDPRHAPPLDVMQEALLDLGDDTVAGIQTEFTTARKDLLASRREVARFESLLERKDRELQKASETRDALLEARREARELDKAVRRLEKKVITAEERHRELREENKLAARQIGRYRQEALKLERSLERRKDEKAELELRNWKLASELGLTKWKLQSMRARKWWRLGGVLGNAIRAPWKIGKAFGVLFSKSTLPERPAPLPRPPGREGASKGKQDQRREAPPKPAPVPKRLIPIAVMADEWLVEGLGYECQVTPVSVHEWRTTLELERPAMLVVAGGGLEALALSPSESRDGMLEAFRLAGVRTVAWDMATRLPSDELLTVADRFDDIYAASETIVEAYRAKLGDGRVHHAPLAVAPRLHNPTEASERNGGVVALTDSFVGETRPDFEDLVQIAKDADLDVVSGPELDDFLSASVASEARIVDDPMSAVKGYRVALAGGAESGDLVTEDILRIAATNTPMVIPHNEPAAILFGPSILQPISEGEAARSFRALLRSDPMRARQSHSALRRVMRAHTLGHRVESMLHPGNTEGQPSREPISIVVPTNRPQRLDHLLSSVGRQTYPSIELVLVLHGIELDDSEVRDRAEAAGVKDLQVVRVSSDVVLGDVINRGFAAASHRLVAKMDDDDYYGDEYLADLADALEFSGADIAGKWAHFAYVEDANSMILRYGKHEHIYREVLAISTLLLDRAIFETVQFPSIQVGSGSIFLKAAAAEGARAYSADRFNYVYMRYSDAAHHTFPISDLHLSSAELVCHGLNLEHAMV